MFELLGVNGWFEFLTGLCSIFSFICGVCILKNQIKITKTNKQVMNNSNNSSQKNIAN